MHPSDCPDLDFWAKCEDIPSRRYWDISLTRSKWCCEVTVTLSLDHWNLIGSSLSPSGCLSHIWRNPIKAFLRYCINKLEMVFVRSQWPWPLTTKIESVHPWVLWGLSQIWKNSIKALLRYRVNKHRTDVRMDRHLIWNHQGRNTKNLLDFTGLKRQ